MIQRCRPPVGDAHPLYACHSERTGCRDRVLRQAAFNGLRPIVEVAGVDGQRRRPVLLRGEESERRSVMASHVARTAVTERARPVLRDVMIHEYMRRLITYAHRRCWQLRR